MEMTWEELQRKVDLTLLSNSVLDLMDIATCISGKESKHRVLSETQRGSQ